MNSEDFVSSLIQLKRKQEYEESDKESKRLKQKEEHEKEIQEKLLECRASIFNAIRSNSSRVRVPIFLPEYFIEEMIRNKIWLSNPTNYRWDEEIDMGGGMGFGPASDKSKIISVYYSISLTPPIVPEYSY